MLVDCPRCFGVGEAKIPQPGPYGALPDYAIENPCRQCGGDGKVWDPNRTPPEPFKEPTGCMGVLFRLATWVVGAGLLLVLFRTCVYSPSDLAEPIYDDSDPGRVTALTGVEIGDCFSPFTVGRIEPQSCAEPHEYEVVGQFILSSSEPGLPSIEWRESASGSYCAVALRDYLGGTDGMTGLDLGYHVAADEAWERGEFYVVCGAFRPDSALDRGSVRE